MAVRPAGAEIELTVPARPRTGGAARTLARFVRKKPLGAAGGFLVEAIQWRDYPMVQNLVMFIAIVVILSNLAVDLLYGVLDPRVRYGD